MPLQALAVGLRVGYRMQPRTLGHSAGLALRRERAFRLGTGGSSGTRVVPETTVTAVRIHADGTQHVPLDRFRMPTIRSECKHTPETAFHHQFCTRIRNSAPPPAKAA